MIKKIFALLLVSILLFSCGKKGDPIYKEKNKNSELIRTQQSAIS